MAIAVISFAALTFIIFYSGKRLSVYGDMIADHLGLGKAWVGLILMASVTSLPELTVGVSSTVLVGSANLALGNVLGSCVFNLFILSLLDAFLPRVPLFSKASSSHILAAAMSIILVSMVGLGIYLPEYIVVSRWIGISSLLFISVYFISMRIIYYYEEKVSRENVAAEPSSKPEITLKRAVLLYALHAVIVIAAAMFLPGIAETIATETGLGESFVGTLFLAASTSFPEIAVSLAALRIGSYDLAVGNLIGSNMFNILILAISDMFYTQGYLLKDASKDNLVSIFSVIIMTSIAISGLTYRISKKRFLLTWDTLLISGIYVGNLVLLYYLNQ